MRIDGLDHVNLRTARLDAMIGWYRDMLGLAPGWRPDFGFDGAWLYAGDHAVVHLVAVEQAPTEDRAALHLEHFALRASGLADFLAKLRARGEPWRIGRPPDAGIVQVNVADPDGNHIHLDFPESEAAGMAGEMGAAAG